MKSEKRVYERPTSYFVPINVSNMSKTGYESPESDKTIKIEDIFSGFIKECARIN